MFRETEDSAGGSAARLSRETILGLRGFYRDKEKLCCKIKS